METKEEADGHDQSQSTIWELDHGFEEEAVKVDGEVQNPVHSGSTGSPRLLPLGHSRTQSEFATAGHKRTNSFQRLKTQMQRAWRWGGSSRDERYQPSFNLEVLASQKRQWCQLHSKSMVF